MADKFILEVSREKLHVSTFNVIGNEDYLRDYIFYLGFQGGQSYVLESIVVLLNLIFYDTTIITDCLAPVFFTILWWFSIILVFIVNNLKFFGQ